MWYELESNPGPNASQVTALTTWPCLLGQLQTWNSDVIRCASRVLDPCRDGHGVQGEGVRDVGTDLELDAAVAALATNAGTVPSNGRIDVWLGIENFMNDNLPLYVSFQDDPEMRIAV